MAASTGGEMVFFLKVAGIPDDERK